MDVSARVVSRGRSHEATVETEGRPRSVSIPSKSDGAGSAVNGGELLFLALATCYCNDVYREAGAIGLRIDEVEVSVTGKFRERGDPAREVGYDVRVTSPEDPDTVRALLHETDRVAEIQNTLRLGMPLELESVEVIRSGELAV